MKKEILCSGNIVEAVLDKIDFEKIPKALRKLKFSDKTDLTIFIECNQKLDADSKILIESNEKDGTTVTIPLLIGFVQHLKKKTITKMIKAIVNDLSL